MPAIEFTQGARIALDTLSLNGKHAEAYIYDSKSFTQPISWLIKYKKLDSIDLIIGSVKDPDYHELAILHCKKIFLLYLPPIQMTGALSATLFW